MRRIILLCIIFCSTAAAANTETLENVLERVERNMQVKNVIYTAVMNVVSAGEERSMSMGIYIKDENSVYIEVNESSVGHTSRVLRKDGQFWLYIPSAGRSVRIKGHMMKDGFMGSDFTYEDMSEYRKLEDLYDITMEENDSLYILTMNAAAEDAPYKMKKSYIRKDIYLPSKEEIYSSSGRLLKEFEVLEYAEKDGRNIPSRILMKDMLKQGGYTEIIYNEIKILKNLDSKYFQKTYLER